MAPHRPFQAWVFAWFHVACAHAATPFLVSSASGPGLSCEVTSKALDGHIESENGHYSNGVRSCWLITPEPRAAYITLSFRSFRTEPKYDALHVFDGQFYVERSRPCAAESTRGCRLSPAAGFSGHVSIEPLVAHSGAILLILETDVDVADSGFTFAWTASTDADHALPSGRCAPRCTDAMPGNGKCEEACFNAACRWDAGDCDGVCEIATSCSVSDSRDHTCDAHCVRKGCLRDLADCSCGRRLSRPYGFATDGSASNEDYAPSLDECWLLEPNGTYAGQRIALTFARFDVDRFDRVSVYDGSLVTAAPLAPAGGFWGLAARSDATPSQRQISLKSLSRNSSHGALLLTFKTDFDRGEAGFLFGYTVLPLPAGGRHCALDCALDEAHRGPGQGVRGDGVCDAACMNAFCQFDHSDCLESVQCAQSCMTSMLGDGICQPECLVPECNFDNRDCECSNVIEEDAGYRTDGTTIGSYYDNGLSTCWFIRPRLPGASSITLSFARFATEPYYDVLRVFDGSHRGARELYPGGLSGTGYPKSVTSSGPAVLITFTADAQRTLSGFLFGWTTNTHRNDRHKADPGWPSDERCARKCKRTMLGDGVCDEECMNEGCDWDQGDCWTRCSEQRPLSQQSACYTMQVGNGECDPECMVEACGYDHGDCRCEHVIADRSGFRSMGGRSARGYTQYRNQQKACWLIEPPPPAKGARVQDITLSFQRFETEPRFDVVHVFDGPVPLVGAEITDQAIGDPRQIQGVFGLSGSYAPHSLQPMVSRSSSLLVTFASDEGYTGDGFLFGWTTTFDHEAPLPSSECAAGCTADMRGDDKCDAACMNAACHWDAHREGDVSDCTKECAPGCRQEQLGNGLCEASCANPACGYDEVDCSCPSHLLSECDGAASDGSELTAHYNNLQSRCWLIQPDRDNARVALDWERFDTESGHDLVRVYDGASRLDPPLHPGNGYSGGGDLPPSVRSSGGALLVTFDSDGANSMEKGFRFSWSCSGQLRLDGGAERSESDGARGHRRSPNLLTNPSMAVSSSLPVKDRFRGWTLRDVTDDITEGRLDWTLAHSPPPPSPPTSKAAGNAPRASNYDEMHSYTLAGDSETGLGLAVLESTALLGTCCDITPEGRGSMLAASGIGFIREQLVDLVRLGIAPTYLDTAPPVFASERYAALPPGDRDDYHLRVELLDTSKRPLASWAPEATASNLRPAECSSQCEISRVGEGGGKLPFWEDLSHEFHGYGPGLRYIRWVDGGRDGDAYAGHVGTLIDAANLTVGLDPARGCATGCGAHGECGKASGRCECEPGWAGERCHINVASPQCHGQCSGRGKCSMPACEPSGQGECEAVCECDAGWVGRACSHRATELVGASCVEGGGLRSGLDVSLTSDTFVTLGSGTVLSPSDKFAGELAVVRNGVVLPDWAKASAHLQANGTEEIDFSVRVKTHLPAKFGQPTASIEDPSVLSLSFLEAPRSGTELRKGDGGLRVKLRCTCRKPGTTKTQLQIPIPGYCPLALSWTKRCSEGDDEGGGSWGVWLSVIIAIPCCCYGWRRGLLEELGRRLSGRSGRCSCPCELRDLPTTAKGFKYGVLGLWSRMRSAAEEVMAGRMALSEVPAHLRASTGPVGRMSGVPDEELSEML